MPKPPTVDERIRIWTLQRRLVSASLQPTARGHVLVPRRPSPAAGRPPARPRPGR